MNREEYLAFHKELCDKARMLSEMKNRDYAGNGGLKPFANFERCAAMGVCSTEKGFLVRLTDKMSRLSSFSESGEFAVRDESLEDTVIDIVNYSVLLLAYVRSRRNNCTMTATFGTSDDVSTVE